MPQCHLSRTTQPLNIPPIVPVTMVRTISPWPCSALFQEQFRAFLTILTLAESQRREDVAYIELICSTRLRFCQMGDILPLDGPQTEENPADMRTGRMHGVASTGDSWGCRGPEGKRTQCHLSLGLEHPGRGAPSR